MEWHDYIVDGHNRYELCRKHNIDYPVEELDLGDDATIVDVMEWMINTQLGRRNLPPQQRIAVVKKFEKKIQEQAKAKLIESGKLYGEKHPKKSLSPNGETLPNVHTDKELAKLAGVGSGTIARYNRVMNSDNEDLKKKVLAKVLKDLIETNIRQRGIGNPNPIKLGRCIKELERIYGVERGGDRKSNPKVSEMNQENIADMIGISVDTLNNYKKLTELVPELQDWVETGILAPTTAIALIRNKRPYRIQSSSKIL